MFFLPLWLQFGVDNLKMTLLLFIYNFFIQYYVEKIQYYNLAFILTQLELHFLLLSAFYSSLGAGCDGSFTPNCSKQLLLIELRLTSLCNLYSFWVHKVVDEQLVKE